MGRLIDNEIARIVRSAGDVLKDAFAETQTFREKERRHLVSEYDTIVNDMLCSGLRRLHPDDTIFSEESPELKGSAGRKWIIDPIDGTTYFIMGEPYFSISIACEVDGEIVEAHVYNPVTADYYYADSATGTSVLNGCELRTSGIRDVRDSLVAFGFSADMKAINAYYSDWRSVFDGCRKGVGWICPALSICNVARGRVEAFIDRGCSYEGQAAASLILKNAGGHCSNYDGSRYDHAAIGGVFTNGVIEIGRQGTGTPENTEPGSG